MLVTVANALVSGLSQQLGFSGKNLVEQNAQSSTVWQFLFWAAILAPLVEELLFRGWISKKRWLFGILFPLHALVVGWTLATLVFYKNFEINPLQYFFVGLAISVVFFVVWIIKMASDSFDKKPLFTTLKPWVFTTTIWYSAVIFGFAHSTNWIEVGQFWYLIPLLVIPQLIGGISLVFIRVKLGLQYSIMGHFILNLLVTILIYNSMLVDEINQNSPSLIVIYGVLIHICVSAVLEILAFYRQKSTHL